MAGLTLRHVSARVSALVLVAASLVAEAEASGVGPGIELVSRIEIPSASEWTYFPKIVLEGPLLATMVQSSAHTTTIDVVRRGATGAEWEPDGTLPVSSTSAWNLAFLGEVLAYQVTDLPGGPAIQLASRSVDGWAISGALAVEQAGSDFGRLVAGDKERLVSIAGTFWQEQDAEVLTWVRDPGGAQEWSLAQRFPIDGAVGITDLALAGDTLAVLAYLGPGAHRVELFDWGGEAGWIPVHTIAGGSWEDLDLRPDRLALGKMWGSFAGSFGFVELWHRGEAGWHPDATVVAPLEPDGYQGRIGYRVHFLASGDLIAQAFPPPGCNSDPTCEPGPPRGSRLYQFAERPEWTLVARWEDDPTVPEGQVGQELVSSGSLVIANALAAPPHSLRVFATVGPSALEIPTAGRAGLVALAVVLAAAALIGVSSRRRGRPGTR